MSDYVYGLDACPHNYFPHDATKTVNRVSMKTSGGETVGWADYLIEDGWSKFLVFSVNPEHRTETKVLEFIRQVYLIVAEPAQTFWWNATPTMAKYFDQIVALRPDMTFAAGGAIKRIVRATT